jgi:hypothetical protein
MTRYAPQWVQDGSYAGVQDRALIGALWPAGATSGLAVTAAGTPPMNVNVAPGTAAVPSGNGTGSSLCWSSAVEPVAIPPASSQARIDVVTVHPSGADLDGAAAGWILDVIGGTPAASPVAPAVPAGQLAIARVTVPANAASIVAGNIADARPGGLAIGSVAPVVTPRGLVGWAQGPATAINAASGTALTLAVPLVAGRSYEVHGWGGWAQQTTTANTGYISVSDSASIRPAWRPWQMANILANQSVQAGASHIYQPTASGTVTFTLAFLTQAGTASIAVNTCELSVIDIGG